MSVRRTKTEIMRCLKRRSPRGLPFVAHVAIPAAAQTVTLSLNYGGNAGIQKPPAPVTVTNSARVHEVAGLVSGQPPA